VNLYLDSSAAVKLYVEESGSETVRSAVGRAAVVATNIVTRVEVSAAFKKLERVGSLRPADARNCLETFRSDWPDFFRVTLTDAVVTLADSAAWDHDLRGYDAVQLASALQWKSALADDVTFEEILEHSEENEVRCADPDAAEEMRDLADRYQKEGDSIGGGIYFECQGVPRGLGAPRFDSIPSRLGQAMYSIPAVTDFELGIGRKPVPHGARTTPRTGSSTRTVTPALWATTTADSRAVSRPATPSTVR